MKKILLLSLIIFNGYYSYAQPGAKWATGLNTLSTGDGFGSSNNQPINFKTNNTLRMVLDASGNLKLVNLSGVGNRFVQTDASGNIIPFAMGTASQVLYGNGTWGSLPTIPASVWNTSGSNIYFNTGKVGIGTTTPMYPLDVIGDARISNNLYVGGGIVITDKVNATTEVVTNRVMADSIVTDSTKGFYGTSKFNGDVKLQSKLNVDGNATIGGPLKLLGGLTFGTVPPISISPCIELLAISSTGELVQMNATADLTFDPTISPCPEPPVVPFTWQTWGNHVNSDARWIGTIENYDFRIKTNSTLRITVKKDGKVGIGTAVPTELFEVNGNTKVTGNTLVTGNTHATGNSIIDGAVGIGSDLSDPTSAPYKLCVNGFVRAKKVVVETTWSDFVFDEKYNLISLNEVEKFININHHLPAIPSAKEIETNGGDLGELVKLQMQKIEELTLYLIEQNKKMQQIEDELKQLKEKQ